MEFRIEEFRAYKGIRVTLTLNNLYFLRFLMMISLYKSLKR